MYKIKCHFLNYVGLPKFYEQPVVVTSVPKTERRQQDDVIRFGFFLAVKWY